MRISFVILFLFANSIYLFSSTIFAVDFDVFKLNEKNEYRLEILDKIEKPHLILRCGPVVIKTDGPYEREFDDGKILYYDFTVQKELHNVCRIFTFQLKYKDPSNSFFVCKSYRIKKNNLINSKKIELHTYFNDEIPSLLLRLPYGLRVNKIFLYGNITMAPHIERVGFRSYILKFPELKDEEDGIYTLEVFLNGLKNMKPFVEDVFKINKTLIPISKLQTRIESMMIENEYMVNPGDTLYDIATIFNVHPADIAIINDIENPEMIEPGMKLKIGKVVFKPSKIWIKVNINKAKLYLFYGDQKIAVYPSAVGRGSSTPIGKYEIMEKKMNPTLVWNGTTIPPGTLLNGLGSRWIGLSNPQYGIHGTTKPWEIGRRISHGCIRLYNHVVELIFDLVHLGTEVLIVNDEDENFIR